MVYTEVHPPGRNEVSCKLKMADDEPFEWQVGVDDTYGCEPVLLLAGAKVETVHAVGVNVIGEHEDICNARLTFENGCVANITASRLAIKTERKMRIFSCISGVCQMIRLDPLNVYI